MIAIEPSREQADIGDDYRSSCAGSYRIDRCDLRLEVGASGDGAP
jgi:hypothetical protein